MPAWVSVTKDGAAVSIANHCELATCDSSTTPSCLHAPHEVLNVTRGTSSGVTYAAWDGLVRTIDTANNCVLTAPAPSGTYRAEVCYGTATNTVSAGTDVASPACVARDFVYPVEEQVIFTVSGP